MLKNVFFVRFFAVSSAHACRVVSVKAKEHVTHYRQTVTITEAEEEVQLCIVHMCWNRHAYNIIKWRAVLAMATFMRDAL